MAHADGQGGPGLGAVADGRRGGRDGSGGRDGPGPDAVEARHESPATGNGRRGRETAARRRGRRGRRRTSAPTLLTTAIVCLAVGAAATLSANDLLASPVTAGTPAARAVTGDARADALLARMSLADKLKLLEWVPDLTAGAGRTATLPGLPGLGIPSLHLTDGMPGVASRRPAPGMSAPLAVAATFSRRDAHANGAVIGRDARALGAQVVGLPLADLDLADLDSGSLTSRGVATFGQDPLLAGKTAAAEVTGIQRQGTMAMAEDYLPAGGTAARQTPPAGTTAAVEAGTGSPGPDTAGSGVTGTTAAGTVAAVVGSATLHEVYLQPFEDAIKAGLAAIMCSPTTLQVTSDPAAAGITAANTSAPGAPNCDNAGLLTQTLRGELGFGGFITSGWGANTSTLSLNSGLDVELSAPAAGIGGASAGAVGASGQGAGGAVTGEGAAGRDVGASAGTGPGEYFTPDAVRAAVASGSLRPATIDRAVGTVLAEMDKFGLLGPGRKATAAGRERVAADEQVVQRTAEDAATLLKNANDALPLTAGDLTSLALIGPNAGQDVVGGTTGHGGWDASGIPASQASPYQALRKALAGQPGVHMSYASGDDLTGSLVPTSALSHDGQAGLVRTTWALPAQTAAAGGQDTGAQHAGTGSGRGYATAAGGRSARGSAQAVFARSTRVVPTLDNTTAGQDALPAGSAHDWTGELTVPVTGAYRIGLALLGAEGSLTLDGTTIASGGRGSVLTARQGITGPATDGILPTTDGLDNLSARVRLTAGTHTLDVAEVPDASGRPVQIRLEWVTPADEQARRAAAVTAARNARVAVVFGWSTGAAGSPLPDHQDGLIKQVAAVNPDTIVVLQTSGPVALPWFRSVQAVVELWYPGDRGGYASANVLLGRANPAGRLPFVWPANGAGRQDRQVFPFGYGMSYTRFGYSGLSASASGGGVTVRFRVTNTGSVAGQEVPQVYLGPPSQPQGTTFAPKALAAYTRIRLRPGHSREVTLRVPARQLQYWDDARGWVGAPGPRRVYVGPSEGTTALSALVNVPG